MTRSMLLVPTLLYTWHATALCQGQYQKTMSLPMKTPKYDDDKTWNMSRVGAMGIVSSHSVPFFNDNAKNDNEDDDVDVNDDDDGNDKDDAELPFKSSVLRNRPTKDDDDEGDSLLAKSAKSAAVRKRSIINGLVTSSTKQNASSSRILIRVAERSKDYFEYRVTDNLTGIVQTQGYELWQSYRAEDNWHHVTSVIGPLDHVVIVSILFKDLGCPLQRVEIFTGSEHNSWDHHEVTLCAPVLAEPSVVLFHQHFFHMHWRLQTEIDGESYNNEYTRGFRLHFTFHKKASLLPHELPSGLWNCSLSNFNEFYVHFGCNYNTQCLLAEDETNCFFSGNCQSEQIEAHGKCYAFKIPRQPISWQQANLACREEFGTYLASLNTAEEWQGVTDALKKRTSLVPLFVGLKGTDMGKPNVYQYQKEWADGTLAIYLYTLIDWGDMKSCGSMASIGYVLQSSVCTAPENAHYLCELEGPDQISTPRNFSTSSTLPQTSSQVIPFPHVTCPRGHATHTFLICDAKSSCFPPSYVSSDDLDPTSCSVELDPLPPYFVCRSGGENVAYSLVCDHRPDCLDVSDEDFCVFKPCDLDRLFYCGNSKQCISHGMTCDGQLDCVNESDERDCANVDDSKIRSTKAPPAIVRVYRDKHRKDEIKLLVSKLKEPCPQGYFECNLGGYCLELMFRCNGVYDCPGHEDEAWCSDYTCQGMYRCRDSHICLPTWELCDNYPKCPQFDDELFCDLSCPFNCTCYGLAFFCPVVFIVHQFLDCRYLDVSGSGLTPHDLVHNKMLVFLSLAKCGLSHFGNIKLPNLIHLDLRDNNLHEVTITQLKNMRNLQVLLLAGNSLTSPAAGDTELYDLPLTLRSLDLSRVTLPVLHVNKHLPQLQRLNLSATGVDHLLAPGFIWLTGLHVLDLRGCPLSHIPKQLFHGLHQLRRVYSDTYRICCQATLPTRFNTKNCRAPINILSSCEKLLKHDVHVVCMAVFAIICIISNTFHVVLWVFVKKNISESAFSVLLCHLCVSDFVMGMYLAIIAVAHYVYVDSYLWEDVTWRHSVTCKLAGFLFLVSSEVSAFILFSITAERLAALSFPLKWQMTSSTAYLTGLVCWLCGVALATLPFYWKQGHLFTTSGLCIPLPFTAASHGYFHNVIIVFFSVLHVLVFSLQTVIYLKTRPNIMTSLDMERSSSEVSVTRCFLPVALSRSVCWVSLGLVGWTVCQDDSDCSEMKGTMAVVGLPLSSVLQPLTYVYGMWQERQQKGYQKRVMQFMLAKKRARDLSAKGLAGRAGRMKHS